jgi:hypothetical protein
VLGDLEAMFSCHCILERFKFCREEFDNLSTLRADHVIVMLVLVVVLVVRTTVAKPDLTRKASLSQELESSVNGRLSNARIFLLNEPVEIFV